MRLHRLEITGIGPFKDTQVIDIDAVAGSGLFLIEGPTGSGKTTIIDAIVYAMFGVVSAGSDDVTRMRIRSHYCGEADPTGVTCEFSVDGRRWRVSRVPAGCRDPQEPAKAARSKGPRQVLVEIGADGGEGPVLATRKEVDAAIEQLLGMSVEQFRQLVVLPQGQFADLLRQTPVERLRSLEPLLEDGLIARVQADLEQAGRDARLRRDAADHHVDQAAQQLTGRLARWLADMSPEVSFTDPTVPDADRLAVVDDILAALDRQAQRSTQARDEQVEQVEALREAARRAVEVHGALTAVVDAQREVEEARAGLAADDADVTETGMSARLGALQQQSGALETHAAWEGAFDDRQRARAAQVARAAEQRATAAALAAERADLPQRRRSLAAELAEAQHRSGSLASAEREVARLADLVARAGELAGLRTRAADLATTARTVEAAAAQATAAAQAAEAAWRDLLARQHADSAAVLAARLMSGEACPVCGSTEHPSPAVVAESSDAVTAEDVDAAQSVAAEARSRAEEAAAAVLPAHADAATAATAVAALAGALGDQDEAALRDALAVATVERDEAAAAGAAADDLSTRLAALADEDRTLGERIAAAESEAVAIEAAVATTDAAEEARSAEIRAVVGSAESATALLSSIRLRIDALAVLHEAWSRLATAQARIPAGHPPLTLAEAEEQAAQAAHARDSGEHLLAELAELATAVTATRDEARPLARAFRAALTERQAVQRETSGPIELATIVAAGNAKHLQLRSYALQRRFASVLAAATGHLERMSSGKFSFELSEAAAKAGQSGLGISLLDSWTGQPQDPKSLSGGETFYASLALALGLADVVRGEAGGSALETLFVDEGFGSLDQDTLGQVLDQLDGLRAGNRVVGVVSHVSEMKESIPDRLEVRRRPDSTSTIVASQA